VIVDWAVYEDGRRRAGKPALEETYDLCRKNGSFAWLGLYEPSEEEFDAVRREFELHELAVEDAIKAHQRPKLEVYEDTLFLVLKTARYLDEPEEVEFGEILVFVAEGFVVTVRHGEASELRGVRQNVEARPDLLRCGPGAVLHAIVDRVVDDYQPVLAGLEDDIEEVEQDVFSPERTNPAQRIYKLSREVIDFHRATAPLVEPLRQLSDGRHEVVHPDIREYFRDVYDHSLRANETVDAMRELLSGILQANLSQVSVRQNDDVRRISAWVAIIAVPTMVAGVYGMNFEHMPELKWSFGYPLAVAVMLVACTSLYRYFKKAGWL
jgi:magnesium transporter